VERISKLRVICAAATIAVAGVMTACTNAEGAATDDEPIVVEEVPDTGLSLLTLSARAAERLDIQTATIEAASEGFVVPSAAVIIDPDGVYWVYTNPDPLVFIRREIRPVTERAQRAFFEDGPAIGTRVVTVGVPELYGAEFGIGK